jgi:AcrR family transcriptional regulator
MSPRTKAQLEAVKEAAREKILDAGLLLFARQGVAATGVTEIAREAGVSLGLLYHYYASKEELFAALIKMAMEGAKETLAACQEEGSAAEQIRSISRLACGVLRRENRTAHYFLLLIQAGLAGLSPGAQEEGLLKGADVSAPFILLQGLIKEGQAQGAVKAGEPRQLAQLYWAAFQGLCLYKVTMRGFLPPDPEQMDGILLL